MARVVHDAFLDRILLDAVSRQAVGPTRSGVCGYTTVAAGRQNLHSGELYVLLKEN